MDLPHHLKSQKPTLQRPSSSKQIPLSEALAILKSFDLSQKCGPMIGLTRLERYERSCKFNKQPPLEIKELLLDKRWLNVREVQECIWSAVDYSGMHSKSQSKSQTTKTSANPISLEEALTQLKVFDLSSKYGPMMGISRLDRYERSIKFNKHPPPEIKEILTDKRFADIEQVQQCIWNKGYGL